MDFKRKQRIYVTYTREQFETTIKNANVGDVIFLDADDEKLERVKTVQSYPTGINKNLIVFVLMILTAITASISWILLFLTKNFLFVYITAFSSFLFPFTFLINITLLEETKKDLNKAQR